jgi:hypothetical protein
MSLALILGVFTLFAPAAHYEVDALPGTAYAQQATSPTQTPQQTTEPSTGAPVHPMPPDTTPQGTPPAVKKRPRKPAAKKKTRTPKKSTTAPLDEDAPPKRVIHNGSTTEPSVQITPSLPQQQADTQQQKTNSLLNTTEENLRSISGNQLTDSQEEMVKQIRMFVEQAKTAQSAGDLERANNLATKAQLLSEELVKK